MATVAKATGVRRFVIPVEGMSCASCVGRVERAIRGVAGVESAAVNLATGRATVDLASGSSPAPVLAAISGAGYTPRDEAADLTVSGMSCASCVGRVERALKGVPGVLDGAVNLATGRAHARFVGGPETVSAIAAALGAAGHPATPVVTGAEAAERERIAQTSDLSAMRRSVLFAAAATIPLVLFEMVPHWFPALHGVLAAATGGADPRWIALVLASLVQFGPGLVFYRKGLPSLLRGAPDMNALVMLGTTTAYLFSLVSLAAPSWLATAGDGYFESGAAVVTLVLAGRYAEALAKGRTGQAIRRLMSLRATTARIVEQGVERDVPIEAVRVGDLVAIRPGERLPVDGDVVEGSTYIDQSMVTGEPVPVPRGLGDAVVGGTLNRIGAFRFRATRVGDDTLLAQIVHAVEAAQSGKLPIQALVDRVTTWFVPAIMVAALATFVAWLVFGAAPALPLAVVNAVAVLIIACPCAMGLATPTSILVATGVAAEMGVLFRRGEALQGLRDVAVVALDKTGTLTEGHPRLTDIVMADGFAESEVLRLVASVERRSEHPIAEAIVRAAEECGLKHAEVTGFAAEPGLGVSATVEGRAILVGADRMMQARGIPVAALDAVAERLGRNGKSPLYAAVDGRLAAVLAVADPVKSTSAAALRALKQLGLRVVMVTGDARLTAEAIARDLPIDQVVAEVSPTAKADVVRRLQAGGVKVAFVGDGINDAPALAMADVGLAIGTGTDIAIESADAVLMSGDLGNVANAIVLSRATIRNIAQNLAWAFGYNVVLIPVAAGALHPWLGLSLSPMVAGAAMALSSVSVLANALRLKRFRAPLTVGPAPVGRLARVPAE